MAHTFSFVFSDKQVHMVLKQQVNSPVPWKIFTPGSLRHSVTVVFLPPTVLYTQKPAQYCFLVYNEMY